MGGRVRHIDDIDLASTKEGKISISVVDQPYGVDSDSVISVGVFLKKDKLEPDWKVHIPAENVEEVLAALHFAQCKLPH